MTASLTYTALHDAFDQAAHKHRCKPLHARIALVLHEAGPRGLASRELVVYLGGSATVTDAVLAMVRDGRVTALSRVKLTRQGTALARSVICSVRARTRIAPCFEDATPLRELIRSEPVETVVGATTAGDGW